MISNSVSGNCTYSYDPFNRLVGSNQNNGGAVYSYVYDRFGNRWQQNGPHSFLTTFTGNNPGTPQNNNRMDGYSYDAAGNLLNDGTHSYTYDAENRIVQVDGGQTATYAYDAQGFRVHRGGVITDTCYSDTTGIREYLHDLSGRWVFEVTHTGSGCNYEIFAGNRHLGSYYTGETFFSHTDWLGTERYRPTYYYINCRSCDRTYPSLPFGDALGGSYNTHYDPSSRYFTGKERDAESGLDDFGARYDSSSMGRFMSPDPENAGASLEAPQSWNAYSYVLNNPLNAIDPDGLDCVYLNDAGNGVEAIDRGSSRDVCTDSEHGGTYFEGTINSNSVRADPNSDWVSAEGVVEPTGSNQQFSCGGSACGQDALNSFVNSVTGGPSSVAVSGNDNPLDPTAAAILGGVYKDARIVADASELAACTAVGVVFGNGGVPPIVTHGGADLAAEALKNPKTATAAARAYHTATDARFTAGGRFSKVLVPRTAKALSPALQTAGKLVSGAEWALLAYETYKSGKQCVSQAK